jgi:hypothetical protein
VLVLKSSDTLSVSLKAVTVASSEVVIDSFSQPKKNRVRNSSENKVLVLIIDKHLNDSSINKALLTLEDPRIFFFRYARLYPSRTHWLNLLLQRDVNARRVVLLHFSA